VSRDRDPAALRELLDRWGATSGLGSAATVGVVFERWEEIVGPVVAANCQPVDLRSRRLVVETADPAWASQLRWLAPELLGRIRDFVGEGEVDDVVARIRRS
jgi:predicted nucleic acid-binding Zn ribbon protein